MTHSRGGPKLQRTRPKRLIVLVIMFLIAAFLIKRAGTLQRIPSNFFQSSGSRR